jgi:ubiquinone/menaquinone biosynthesis C-methylase UbiE
VSEHPSRPGLGKQTLQRVYAGLARRYDVQHAVTTGGADGRGRRMLVAAAVHPGDIVLDAGAGTGTTTLLAARAVGATGRVVALDLSRAMLAIARRKAEAAGLLDRVSLQAGEIESPPFLDGEFDVVLSTYSTCPLTDPAQGALALYDTLRAGGLMGVAHSSEPAHSVTRRLADWVETAVWRWPGLSMGCRAVSVLPALRERGATVVFERHIGIPLWPFHVFVVRRPALG